MKQVRIALAGLKGGIGKTTLTMVLGSILQETYNKKVCYIDADYFQYPISVQNQREQIFLDRQKDLAKELYAKRGLDFESRSEPTIYKMYEGFERTVTPEIVEKEHPDFDVYIYDFMGSQGYEETYMYLTQMDYIILPTVIDSMNAQPTYYWMSGIKFGKELVLENGGEVRTKNIFLLFNSYNGEDTDFRLKAWLENEARKFDVITLQNSVNRFVGVSKDMVSVTQDNQDFFVSLRLQPSSSYCEATNILQVAEEFLLSAGIIKEPVVEPKPIDDAIELHTNIMEDLKEQLEELSELTGNVTSSFAAMSEKQKAILETYNNLLSMSVEEIREGFGRKVVKNTYVPETEVSEDAENNSEEKEKVEGVETVVKDDDDDGINE